MNAPGHKPFLLDCCNAASTEIDVRDDLKVLATSRFETIASFELQRSFTQHMINILRDAKGAAVNVSCMCARMVDKALSTNLEVTSWHDAAAVQSSITIKAFKFSRASQIYNTQSSSNGKVFIFVAFASVAKVPDSENFVKRLTENIPFDVEVITVKGVFAAYSAEYLLTVLIAV